MQINTIVDAKKILSKQKIIGVYFHAFQVIMPAFFNTNMKILCYQETLDNPLLRKKCHILSIRDSLESVAPSTLLKSININNIVPDLKNYWLYVRKPQKKIENIAEELGLKIIGNKSDCAKVFENKKNIRDILTHVGIEPIVGENISYKKFGKISYKTLVQKYGEKIVIQLPDINKGGGFSTFFINDVNDFNNIKHEISSGSYKGKTINSINITKFIDGISASIVGCATQYGTLTSTIQTQIIGVPEVSNPSNGKALYCGHDRSFRYYSSVIQKKADNIVQKLGKYMYSQGYRGIFGLDVLIHKNEVYVVECNARYTGAFPMLSMIDYKAKKIPMEVFHILECMNIQYTIDFDKINKSYKYKKQGSHLILSNKINHNIVCKKDLKAGVYRYKKGKIVYIRKGIDYSDLEHKDDFIIIDGNPRKGDKIEQFPKPSRFCHILRNKKIITGNNAITANVKKIIECIYDTYTTQEIG